MNYNLNRFIKMQDKYYSMALEEIKNGEKTTHWIWFIFPQLKGLGVSDYSKYYGINGIDEAKAYIHNPILKKRLVEITYALLNQEKSDLVNIVGAIDADKIQACMTLFFIVTKAIVFKKVLIKYFNDELHYYTLKLLKGGK